MKSSPPPRVVLYALADCSLPEHQTIDSVRVVELELEAAQNSTAAFGSPPGPYGSKSG